MANYCCVNCGGTMLGNGVTEGYPCEYTEYPADLEKDARHVYCCRGEENLTDMAGEMKPTDPKRAPWRLGASEVDYRPHTQFVALLEGKLGHDPLPPFSVCLSYTAPQGNQVQRMQEISGALADACDLIERLCPPSRERNLALTDLQSARMFANASIMLHEGDTHQ